MIESARRGRAIPLVGSGDDIVCPVHVDDLVPAMVAAVSTQTALGRTYVLGGEPMTLREVAECRRSPDQLARLRAEKPRPGPEAEVDLGFVARDFTPA